MNRSKTAIQLLLSLLISSPVMAEIKNAEKSLIDLPRIMELLREVKERKNCFREQKASALLTEPLLAFGKLEFSSPDHLAKFVQTPEKESFIADGERLEVENFQGKKSVDLSKYPALQAFVAGIRATLAGDSKTLEKYYAVKVNGTEQQWMLQLVPLNTDMLERVKSLKINGQRQHIASIETIETSGDRSTLEIQPNDVCGINS